MFLNAGEVVLVIVARRDTSAMLKRYGHLMPVAVCGVVGVVEGALRAPDRS